MKKEEIKISVIIPVHNTEKYIGECLESVINQDYDSFEVICINDFSEDDSLRILKMYEEKYSCIKVINFNDSNKGVATARNCGIRNANGKYIFFLDSDDCITNEVVLENIKVKLDEEIATQKTERSEYLQSIIRAGMVQSQTQPQ